MFGDNQVYAFEAEPSFLAVLRAVDDAGPAFTLMVGDAIYSETSDLGTLVRKWDVYRGAVARLKAPVVQAPGNHDAFDGPSRALWRELWGDAHFAFDVGDARIVVVDCETEEEGRIDRRQFAWLEETMDEAGPRHLFVAVHRPAFPVVGHVGDSLDVDPAGRDRLHALFRRHVPRLKGVFSGHEHIHDHQDVDGVPYYHCGGGGAKVYAAPQKGGYHHFLLVEVDGDAVSISPRAVLAPPRPVLPARRIGPGALVEGWSASNSWTSWNQTTTLTCAPAPGREGPPGILLRFHGGLYPTPSASLALAPSAVAGADAVEVDVHLPAGGPLPVVMSLGAGEEEGHAVPETSPAPGWTTLRLDMARAPEGVRKRADALSWTFRAAEGDELREVLLYRPRAVAGSTVHPLDALESGLLWHAWNEAVNVTALPAGGVRIAWGADAGPVARVFGVADPALDLSGAPGLTLEHGGGAGLASVALDSGRRLRSAWLAIGSGPGAIAWSFAEAWAPAKERSEVSRVELSIRPARPGPGSLELRALRAKAR